MKTAKLFSIFVILALGHGQNSVLPMSLVQANNSQKSSLEQAKLTASSGSFDWHIEPVQTFTSLAGISEHSLRIDSQGIPHIAYVEGGSLYYAWRNITGWQKQIVITSPDLGSRPSLVLGAGDVPYISFYDSGGLKVTIWNGTAWDIQTVDTAGTGRSSIALDGLGNPHISYDSTDGLKYASKTGTGWVMQPVDSQGWNSSLAIDSSGTPHIGYFASSVKVNHARWNGSDWEIHTLHDISGPLFFYLIDLSLALDPADYPHMIFSIWDDTPPRITYDYLLYAYWTGTQWNEEYVVTSEHIAGISLAINKAGQASIAYCVPGYLNLAIRDGETWNMQVVYNKNFASLASPSLAFDPQGMVRIIYLQVTSSGSDLYYAEQFALPLLPPVLEKKIAPQTGVHPGEPVTYTLNVSAPWRSVYVTDALPAQVEYISGTLSTTIGPDAFYNPLDRTIYWQGTLPGTLQTIQFQVMVDNSGDPASTPLVTNTAWLSDPEHDSSTSAFAILNGWRAYNPMIVQNYP